MEPSDKICPTSTCTERTNNFKRTCVKHAIPINLLIMHYLLTDDTG